MNNKTYLIKKAYELLERVTPLRYDCGKLCDGLCCKGDGKITAADARKILRISAGLEKA